MPTRSSPDSPSVARAASPARWILSAAGARVAAARACRNRVRSRSSVLRSWDLGCRVAGAEPQGLFDDLQLRAARAALFRLRRVAGGLGTQVLLGEHHALAGLAGIDAKHRPHREAHVMNDPGEARIKLHHFGSEAQALRGALAQVQHDLAVLDVGARDFGALAPG